MDGNDPNAAFKEALSNADLAQFPDFDQVKQTLEAVARSNVHHSWHQEGPNLVCDSCSHRHSQWVGMDKRLNGFDNAGRPTFEDVSY